MPAPPVGHSLSIDSTSSFSSSKSSLLAPPIDDVSSQSDVADAPPPCMPPSDTSVYGVAASPTHPTSNGSATPVSSVSATQKLKRAFGKRRRPSQDAGLFLSSGDERHSSDNFPPPSSSHYLSSIVPDSSPSRPSAAKLTMHLFGARRHHEPSRPDPNLPPPLPPKPLGLRAPHPPVLQMPPNNIHGTWPHNSVMIASPSITAAIEFMREDEERQRAAEQERECTATESRRELEENKEKWRKSDSTMGSVHTVRPSNNTTDSGPGVVDERLSAYLATPPGGGQMDLLEFLAGAPEPEGPGQNMRPTDTPTGRQVKRRSLSLNIHVPSTHATTQSLSVGSPSISTPSSYPTPSTSGDSGPLHDTHSQSGHTVAFTSSSRETPAITRTPTNGTIWPGTASGSSVSKTNIRGRLAALTATTGTDHRPSSPSPASGASMSTPSLTSPLMTSPHQTPHRRVIVTSDASHPSPSALQSMIAARQLQSRVRSPSASSTSSSASIRQAATSLTSGAGAMAFGLGKRAYEKVGRVWGGSQSGSGSGSDTPNYRQPSPVNSYAANISSGCAMAQPFHNQAHGPSAFPSGRRTPATSGSWSVSSMGGSRSSSEKDRTVSGPELSGLATSTSVILGRLIRPPRTPMGGVVFGKELWVCVKDTRAAVTGSARDPLGGRMIPALVYRCAQHLHKWGLEEEGLFRISGRSSHISRLRNEFDGGADYDITECSPSELDPHAVASVFKAYLRELPEPVLTRSLGPSFDSAINAENIHATPTSASGIVSKSLLGGGPGLPAGPRSIPTIRKPPSLSTFTLPTSSSLRAPSSALIEALGDLIARLPQENKDILLTVVELMNATAARSKETKMPLSNLLLVFCPSLSMAPTLLRVLCDVPGIWEPRSPVAGTPTIQSHNEVDETDESTSESDSEFEDENLVVLPAGFKDKGKEVLGVGTQLTVPKSYLAPESAEPHTEEVTVSRATSRSPPLSRRVHIPNLYLDNKQMGDSHPHMAGSFTPPLLSDPPLRSGSTPSLEIPSRSRTPLSSPMQSEVSLNSIPDKHFVVPSPRQQPSSSQTSVFVSWLPPKYDKALPASPRSPISAPVTSSIAQEEAQHHASPLDEHCPNESVDDLSSSTTRSPKDVNPKWSLPPLVNEINSDSTPQHRLPKDAHPDRSLSLPTPLVLASKSAPNVVFPSCPKTTPSTPTSLKKHALTLSLGRSPKMSDDEELPSPSKRLSRRPSLNMLFNLKRGSLPSPRSRTPTISSPLASPASLDRAPQISPTLPTPFPPVLTLPIEGSIDVGLGWDDVFGSYEELAPMLAQQPTVSQPSAQHPRLQSASLSHQPPTEYPISDVVFGSTASPLAPSSTTAVLGVESSASTTPSSPVSSTSVVFQADASSTNDRLLVEFPKQPSPVEEPLSPPPHINFQLRRSSLEDEDWASIVLLAAGRPAESLA